MQVRVSPSAHAIEKLLPYIHVKNQLGIEKLLTYIHVKNQLGMYSQHPCKRVLLHWTHTLHAKLVGCES